MFLNVSKMRGAHDRVERTYDASAFESAPNTYRIVAPVVLMFDIYKDHVRFRLVGSVGTTLELTCSRCLEPFQWPVAASFDLRYLPQDQNAGEGEREIEEDDLTTAYYRDDSIDLGQLMREQFYLALPMKPLCSPGCLGLCPQCGANLNQGSCACAGRWEDPRLAGLRAFHKKSE